MTDNRRVPTGRVCRPQALLLDFGGVIVLTRKNPNWASDLAAHVFGLLEKASATDGLTPELITEDIKAGSIADSHWKNAMSRPMAPRELRYEEFWGDFVAADWPGKARDLVVSDAKELCRVMGHMRSVRELRNGLLDLLDAADAAGVPVGIVSNALSGQVHLDILAEHGLTHRFAVEVHSDAVALRKPNPDMIRIAAERLGVPVSACWYVGDNFDRDVLCGIRAGVGGNILMEAPKTYDLPYDLRVRPDAIVADPRGLLDLFTETLKASAA
ncbi:hypothetical protein [Devosia sp. DBB001]|nr:hypothetical protein [Devosia sp. DBB001]